MGNKLSVGEERESMSAVLDYLKDNGILTLPKNVSVIKNGKLIVNDRIDVAVFDCNIYMRVDILWEEAGYTRYSDLGLYGSYGSSYYRMTYVDRILKINSDDNIEIVIK
ncbi:MULTISPECIES: hypothetical protein [Streptococcus]|jgi:hypothetical protein|uniref:hypothetical protein n=1 Tax=Streptococcus TaxID=1301 RepID=UPI0001F88DA0|nr:MULTISPECIES: hypothetical protein [Streptococcus]EFX57078.1 hypothetical protein HMPREF0849_00253 [Streptococcus sp. C300]MDK7171332.1 hypothetical protein [Streptococcus oralis]MDK8112027.1 hypothetical protein [Streptococcus oralis]MDO6345627.1 hypothetical protein [Streptococcus sp. GP0011]